MISWTAARADDVVLDRIYSGGKGHMDFLVSRDELRKVRPWEPKGGTRAPLSRNQALEVARKAAATEGLDISDTSELEISLTKTNPFEDELIKRLPPGCCLWFYQIEFKGDDSSLNGRFTFLVTMSGALGIKRQERP